MGSCSAAAGCVATPSARSTRIDAVSEAERYGGGGPLGNRAGGATPQAPQPANLADILERVLDKGIVIAGDIQINLLDIELLTIKLRLLVASVDKAREMGID